jgi:hypothetical protein
LLNLRTKFQGEKSETATDKLNSLQKEKSLKLVIQGPSMYQVCAKELKRHKPAQGLSPT